MDPVRTARPCACGRTLPGAAPGAAREKKRRCCIAWRHTVSPAHSRTYLLTWMCSLDAPSFRRLYKPVDQEEALRDAFEAKRKRADETEEARQDRRATAETRPHLRAASINVLACLAAHYDDDSEWFG